MGVVRQIHRKAEPNLVKIADAFGGLGRLIGSAERGQQQRGKNGDDGDDHEKFDECESPSARHPAIEKPGFHNERVN